MFIIDLVHTHIKLKSFVHFLFASLIAVSFVALCCRVVTGCDLLLGRFCRLHDRAEGRPGELRERVARDLAHCFRINFSSHKLVECVANVTCAHCIEVATTARA